MKCKDCKEKLVIVYPTSPLGEVMVECPKCRKVGFIKASGDIDFNDDTILYDFELGVVFNETG